MRSFDYSTLKEKTWDHEIISLIAQIHEYKGRQEVYLKQKPEELNKLVEIAKRQSTEASNAIEGIRTTNARLKELCEEKTTPKNRDEEEILGYRDVLNTIHENYEYIPIRTNYILQLHRDLYKYTEKSIGGHFKISQNVIASIDRSGKEYILFTPLAPYETAPAMDAICESYNKMIENDELDAILLIPIFIHDFLCIHPFSDGNGRMSRLLTALLLYRSGYVVGKYISIESKIANNKDLYYKISMLGPHRDDFKIELDDKDILLRIKASLEHLEANGPNTVLGVVPDGRLLCVCDSKKLRPVVIGRDKNTVIMTSEVAGVNDLLPNRDIRLDIYPKEREMVVVNNDLTVERWQQ